MKQLTLYETWQFWGESNKSKHWFWFRHNRGRHCVGDWCKERKFFFLPAIQLHVWKCLLWEMIFYFSLLHGVHCTPVACYYTTDISTHHSLEASGKMQKVLFLLKRVYKVHKISDVSSFNLRKSKWYPGMSFWRVISSVGFEENQDYENLAICNMRTSFQRHKFLVYLKDSMKNVLLYCLEDYSFVTLVIQDPGV